MSEEEEPGHVRESRDQNSRRQSMTVELENMALWREFNNVGTEMIVTKLGRLEILDESVSSSFITTTSSSVTGRYAPWLNGARLANVVYRNRI